jgi:hypothetical protein
MRNIGLAVLLVLALGIGTIASINLARANLMATPPSIDFGSVVIGLTDDVAVLLVADMGFIVGSAGGSGINVPFSFNQGTSNADFTVFHSIESFSPLTPGLMTGTLVIAACPAVGPCIPTDIPLRGIGVASLPVPEPPGVLLLATGALALGFGTLRRRGTLTFRRGQPPEAWSH